MIQRARRYSSDMGYHKEECYHQQVFINDLIKKFPSPVKCTMYADDFVLWSTEEYATTAKIRLQEAINILSSWTQDWCVKIDKTTYFTTLFTFSTKTHENNVGWHRAATHTLQHILELPLTRDRPEKHTSVEQKQRQDASYPYSET